VNARRERAESKDMDGKEQRRNRRVETKQSVWVEGQEVRLEGEARNMSKSGMFVVAPQNAPGIGSMLEIKFEDPKEGQVSVKMEVVWRNEKTNTSQLGLRAIESEGIAAFERVVTRYLAESDAAATPAQGIARRSQEQQAEKDAPQEGGPARREGA
jgi:hypothetical protein